MCVCVYATCVSELVHPCFFLKIVLFWRHWKTNKQKNESMSDSNIFFADSCLHWSVWRMNQIDHPAVKYTAAVVELTRYRIPLSSRGWQILPRVDFVILTFPLVSDDLDSQLQMSQWLQVLQLDWGLQSQVSSVYEGRFPREIRHCLHDVIESKDW